MSSRRRRRFLSFRLAPFSASQGMGRALRESFVHRAHRPHLGERAFSTRREKVTFLNVKYYSPSLPPFGERGSTAF